MEKDLVLIINGAGTNGSELKSLYKELARNEKYFVYYPGIMPGAFIGTHFPKSTTKNFIEFIDSTMEIVNQQEFKNVYLIGYSLGASTAAIMASRSDKIKKLILIAPIVKNPNYSKFLRGLSFSLSYSKNLTRVQKIFYSEFIKRFIKVPKIHIWHLQVYLHFTKNYLKKIDKPTLIIETINDELVKRKTIDQIEKNMDHQDFERYKVDSSHFLFFDRDVRDDVINKVKTYLEEE
ncbi:Alpha/beta hydrolase family protein [Candidatus Izimaplasma bacterium HR1]|jgi:esterase/lipase|uniref:alpha/beta hydrolase n=1 Tax=Candidatus Izimoplasma sp. HR1 TaxID=1541959 RepID=UPI0004F7D839|nr:Alpha/beta hydrolase family protein [Candidatus Izimaplasma bacterium HR1]